MTTAPTESHSSLLAELDQLEKEFEEAASSKDDAHDEWNAFLQDKLVPSLFRCMKRMAQSSQPDLDSQCPADCGTEDCQGECGGRGLTQEKRKKRRVTPEMETSS